MQSSWDCRSSIGPMLLATIKGTIPLTIISFVLGLVIALVVALMRALADQPWCPSWLGSTSRSSAVPRCWSSCIDLLRAAAARTVVRPVLAAIIAFSLNVGGYAAEVIRVGDPVGARRASGRRRLTIGMGYATTLRRVILPQAARTAVPPLSNTLISLVKDTSLASVVLVTELLRVAQIAAAPTFQFFALYGVAALYYWVICLVMSFVQARLETRLERHVAR